MIEQREFLDLGPKLLVQYGNKVLKRLSRATTSTDKRKALRNVRKGPQRKMARYVEEAHVALAQLPEVAVLCATEEFCYAVDNTAALNQHINAVLKLRNTITRVLNRSTRLVFPTVEIARKRTKKFGREVRRFGKELVNEAKKFPPNQFVCD